MTYAQYAINIIPMAFLLSFGHCVGMCGGFVMAYSVKLNTKSKFEVFIYALFYHLSRISAYIVLGAIAGAFGSIFAVTARLQGYIYFFVGILLIILGIALIRRGEILKFIENDTLWSKFLGRFTKFAMQSSSLKGFCLLGFLNGLLPCGVVYIFIAMAITSSDILMGSYIMAVFGICTIPVMLLFSTAVNLLSLKFKNTMLLLSAILVIVFGIYNAYLGFMATK